MKLNLADIATLSSGRLFVSVDRLYALYNELLGDNLFTHQLPGACRFVEPFAATKYPELHRAISDLKTTPQNYLVQLETLRDEFGDYFELSVTGWEKRDPFQELSEMVDPKKIIVVESE